MQLQLETKNIRSFIIQSNDIENMGVKHTILLNNQPVNLNSLYQKGEAKLITNIEIETLIKQRYATPFFQIKEIRGKLAVNKALNFKTYGLYSP